MKKTLFILVASALLLACSSNNGSVKANTSTQQPDSVVNTELTEFDSLLLCFSQNSAPQSDANADTIPDRYCYDFLLIAKDSMFYKYMAYDYDADKKIPASGKLKIRPELMRKSENYVLLLYSLSKDEGGEWDSADRYYYLKTFTPDGTLLQSLDNIAKKLYGEELFPETKDYYFKNDSTLYVVHLSTANDKIYSEEMPTEANDTATVVELTKYSVLKNGHVNNSGHKKFTLQQPYFLGEEGQEPGALIYRPQKEREAKYKVWTENLK